jgi:hypothetical protein
MMPKCESEPALPGGAYAGHGSRYALLMAVAFALIVLSGEGLADPAVAQPLPAGK